MFLLLFCGVCVTSPSQLFRITTTKRTAPKPLDGVKPRDRCGMPSAAQPDAFRVDRTAFPTNPCEAFPPRLRYRHGSCRGNGCSAPHAGASASGPAGCGSGRSSNRWRACPHCAPCRAEQRGRRPTAPPANRRENSAPRCFLIRLVLWIVVTVPPDRFLALLISRRGSGIDSRFIVARARGRGISTPAAPCCAQRHRWRRPQMAGCTPACHIPAMTRIRPIQGCGPANGSDQFCQTRRLKVGKAGEPFQGLGIRLSTIPAYQLAPNGIAASSKL